MCGIAGFTGRNRHYRPDFDQLRRMNDVIAHRGPDDDGLEVLGHVALGMRRLSIIDIQGGAQPIYNEDRSVRVTFNGEIYNFRELRRSLEKSGHQFSTRSDTEVIVHAYEEFGLDFPRHLNGMFAIALHDVSADRVVIARDHLGVKPVFYAVTEDAVVWASEIKSILETGLVEKSLDVTALNEFLTWEYVPGERTLFNEIKKLLPGHTLVVSADGRVDISEYWDLPTAGADESLSESEWLEVLDETLRRSVRRQLVSDVPLGAFLSGGVDSSLVVAAMGNARTFSIGFDDPSYNELEYSNEVARHLGTKHQTKLLEAEVASLFDKLMYHLDDPIGDFSIFPTYLVSKLARDSVTVALSGDGGDELFGGYEAYHAQKLGQRYDTAPRFVRSFAETMAAALPPTSKKKGLINKIKRFTEGAGYDSRLGHSRWRLFLGDTMRDALFSRSCRDQIGYAGQHIVSLFDKAGQLSDTNRCLYVDTKSYLVDNCLVKTDRMSMAESLEVRVPLLDKELAELAFRMPSALKLKQRQTKYLLKKLAAQYLPKHCVYRPKEGFSIPIKNWLGTQFRPILDRYTERGKLGADGLFNADTVQALKNEHLDGRANHSHVLWSLVVFHAWKERWLDG